MPNIRPVCLLTLLVLNLTSIPACSSVSEGERLLGPVEPRRASSQPARPAMIVGNETYSRNALWDVLAEIAGKEAIRETVLDHAVSRELERVGLVITEADVEIERDRLTSRLAPDADETRANEIVLRVLDGRGLGPTRLGRLLRRNAGMRKLVASEAEPSAEMIDLAHEIRYGETFDVRMIVTPTAASAQTAIGEIRRRSSERGLSLAFAEAARDHSADASASLGGDLGAISPVDPGLPVAVRQALAGLEPQTLSPIIALDNGFGVLLIEKVNPAQDVSLESVYDELQQEVRLRQERLLMNRLAERLIVEYQPSVLDGSLRWSWDR